MPSWGVTLHMTGYAPTYTKSVEKGSFLTNDGVDVFCKKGVFFAINRTLGVPEWVELFVYRAENGMGKQRFENLCKIVKKTHHLPCFILRKASKAIEC